ncbi:MAG: PQQ-like beta-propeller repeat protein [Actinobacteria bacterium]|nr:PQQ-like beta-propeller repeat protein [Actinomycetota bacterium]
MRMRVVVLIGLCATALLASAHPPVASEPPCMPVVAELDEGLPAARVVVGCVGGTTTPGAAPAAVPGCVALTVDDRCEAWTSERFDGPGAGEDRVGPGLFAEDTTTVSPDGATAYVAVTSDAATGTGVDFDALVLAHDTGDGTLRWVGRYAGDTLHAYARGMEVSADGQRLYALSTLNDGSGSTGGAVTAFDTSDGALLWSHRLDFRPEEIERVDGPTGDRLLISLHRKVDEQRSAMGLSALDVSSTGAAPAWERPWRPSAPWGTTGGRLASSIDGTRVFLGGGENGDDGLRRNFGTVAYDTATGEQLWEALEPMSDPDGFFNSNGVSGLAVAPDGGSVFAVGFDPVSSGSFTTASTSAIVVFAYDAATGERRWETSYLGDDGEGFYFNLFENTIDVSPDSASVAVVTEGGQERPTYAGSTTVVYDAASGAVRWAVPDGDPRPLISSGYVGYYPQMTFSGDGSSVVITERRGQHSAMNSVTTAFATEDGSRQWAARYTVGSTYPRGIEAVGDDRVIIPTVSRTVQTGFPVPNPNIDTVDVLTLSYVVAS